MFAIGSSPKRLSLKRSKVELFCLKKKESIRGKIPESGNDIMTLLLKHPTAAFFLLT